MWLCVCVCIMLVGGMYVIASSLPHIVIDKTTFGETKVKN